MKKEAIYVNEEEIQKEVFEKYGVRVPMYQVYSISDNFYNSSLYFEMWEPSTKIINED